MSCGRSLPHSTPSDLDGRPPKRRWPPLTTSVVALLVIGAAFYVVTRAALPAATPPRPDATASLGPLADPGTTYDPVAAGEPLPPGFRQLLPRDGILPVYDPQFIEDSTNQAWDDDTLVIGLAIDGEAKAYPVSFLNRREMVVDSIAGIPVLVTW